MGSSVGAGGVGESDVAGLVGKGVGGMRNPAGALMGGVSFLPHAVLIALAIAMIPIILDELSKPGGPMDTRWKRIMSDEANAFLDRQDQHNTSIGLRGVIIQSAAGFISNNGGAGDSNSKRLARKGWTGLEDVSALETVDHSKGLW